LTTDKRHTLLSVRKDRNGIAVNCPCSRDSYQATRHKAYDEHNSLRHLSPRRTYVIIVRTLVFLICGSNEYGPSFINDSCVILNSVLYNDQLLFMLMISFGILASILE
jgi:hypothetical protein